MNLFTLEGAAYIILWRYAFLGCRLSASSGASCKKTSSSTIPVWIVAWKVFWSWKYRVGRHFVCMIAFWCWMCRASRVGLRGVELRRHRRGRFCGMWRACVQRRKFSQPLEIARTTLAAKGMPWHMTIILCLYLHPTVGQIVGPKNQKVWKDYE